MAKSAVDPKEVRFTTASILVSFEASPLKDMHIDNTVDLLLSENWPSCNCPILPVIRYENTLWSLQNQWLWVYRRAKFPQVDALVLDAALEPPDAFLATAKTPDVACFLALLKKPQQMARMKSEMFFPTVRGDWKIHHSDELINAIRIRPGSNSFHRTMGSPNSFSKFGPRADHTQPAPPPEPSSILPLLPIQTGIAAEENATNIAETSSSPWQSANFSGLQADALELGYSPEYRTVEIPRQCAPPSDQSSNGGLGGPPVHMSSTSSANLISKSSPDDGRFSEAILAAMSAAAMHGLTFTVPVNLPSARCTDAPVATLTGYFVP